MRNRLISILLIAIICICSVTACGNSGDGSLGSMSKSELLEEYNKLAAAYNKLATEHEQLKVTASALTSDGKVSAAITTVGDGTGRFTFNSNDSKIIFPSSFIYPNSTPLVPNGKINITSSVSIAPSSTWITRINGSSLELEQSTNKISGSIKVNQAVQQIPVEQIKSEVLAPWFTSISNETVLYKDIFITSSSFGKQAEVPIMINSENAYLICGMAAFGSNSVTYVFVYRGDQDATKNELIMNLLNTLQIDGYSFVIQN